jgi:hypothetical protein
MHPDPDFTGLHEIGDPRVRHLLRLRETCQQAVNVTVRSMSGAPPRILVCAGSERGPRNARMCDFATLKPIDATALSA